MGTSPRFFEASEQSHALKMKIYVKVRNDLPSLRLDALGHGDQPWYDVGGTAQGCEYREAGIMGATLEAGYHIHNLP